MPKQHFASLSPNFAVCLSCGDFLSKFRRHNEVRAMDKSAFRTGHLRACRRDCVFNFAGRFATP